MTLRAGRIEFSFEYLPLAAACVCAVVFGERFLASALCVAIHESGHIIALILTGSGEIELSLGYMTIDMTDREKNMKRGASLALTAVCGPLANLLAAPVFYAISMATGSGFLYDCAMINLALCIFNMLPVLGTDGGEIAQAFFRRVFSYNTAETIMYVLTAAVLLPVCVCAFYVLLVSKNNFTLLIAALCLAASLFKR